MANLAPYVLANAGIFALSSASSSLIPTISSPEPAYFALSACSLGKELLQGVQNVPQKSTSTTFPWSRLSETDSREPPTDATLKSGAGLPTRPAGVPGEEGAGPPAPAATQ